MVSASAEMKNKQNGEYIETKRHRYNFISFAKYTSSTSPYHVIDSKACVKLLGIKIFFEIRALNMIKSVLTGILVFQIKRIDVEGAMKGLTALHPMKIKGL